MIDSAEAPRPGAGTKKPRGAGVVHGAPGFLGTGEVWGAGPRWGSKGRRVRAPPGEGGARTERERLSGAAMTPGVRTHAVGRGPSACAAAGTATSSTSNPSLFSTNAA